MAQRIVFESSNATKPNDGNTKCPRPGLESISSGAKLAQKNEFSGLSKRPRANKSVDRPNQILPTMHHRSTNLLSCSKAISTSRNRTRYHKRPHSIMNQISLVVVFQICYFLSIYQILTLHLTVGAQIFQDTSEPLGQLQEIHQHNNILKFTVPENKSNHSLGFIRSIDNQLPYLIVPLKDLTPEIEIKQAFNFNLTNGEITSVIPLDREYRDQYHFVAIVKEPFAEIKCHVEVLDANDNAPKFLTQNPNESNIVIDMPENQSGFRQLLPLAVDYDSAKFGIKEFRIISGNTPSGTFHLVEHAAPARSELNQNGNLGLVGTMDDSNSRMLASASDNPQLRNQLDQEATVLIPSQPVQQSNGATSLQSAATRSFLIDLEASLPLDRENQSSYTLHVEAIDGGQPPLTGRLIVTVNVLDANDNDPAFSAKTYDCSVSENALRGALVCRVQAYDVDLGQNGQVNYTIKRVTSSSQQAANSTNLGDYNNEMIAGRFASTKPRGQSQASPSSTQSINKTPAGQQRVGANIDFQDISYRNRPQQAPEALFEIDSKKGEIYLVNQLDFETDQMHEIIIEAKDNGKPSRSSYTSVKVHVIDAKDDPLPIPKSSEDSMRSANGPGNHPMPLLVGNGETLTMGPHGEFNSQAPFNWILATNWFSQMNSSILFVIVFVALVAVTFPVCLIKMKSRQPESDYNDTAGLTTPSNNGQSKPSPNHSTSNIEHSNGLMNDSLHHLHHDHHGRRPPNLNGSYNGQNLGKMSGYDSSSNHYQITHPAHQQRPRHHSSSSRHLLSDPQADHHQMPSASGIGGSRGGTMTLSHNHHHHHHHLLNQAGHHHSLEHHHNQFSGGTLNSLAFAHSHAMLLHQAHHHQSTHHLSHATQLNGSGHLTKGGTMNSVGTHNSAHHHPPSTSPMPITPNTINSSMQQANMHHDHSHHHGHRPTTMLPSLPQTGQLPPTPTNQINTSNVFSYPPSHGPGSTLGCYPDGTQIVSGLHERPGSTMDSCSSQAGGATTPVPLDRWTELGVPAQLVNTQDWCGTYDWDYLEQWTPEYHTLLPLIQADESSPAASY